MGMASSRAAGGCVSLRREESQRRDMSDKEEQGRTYEAILELDPRACER